MENIYKLLFSVVGALFLIIAMGSYIKAEQSMKQFQWEAKNASHDKTDDWVLADSSLVGKVEEGELFRETVGGVFLLEVSKEYIMDFLTGYQGEGRDDNLVQVLFEGELYYASDFDGLIREIEKNDSYCIKVGSDFQYELIVNSKE
ncbi:MAG: hypothetical protein JW708_02110 [Vallitaleaceae bacterium]|nr:hypothetical protein [Vallitaleaceae bacterium]